MTALRAVVIDDHPLLRQAIHGMLSSGGSPIEIVGEAATAREGIEVVGRSQPDLVILDLLLPGAAGCAVIRDVRARTDCRVLVYTAVAELALAREAFEAGADGYAIKTDGADELLRAIDRVGNGRTYVAPALQAALVSADADGYSKGTTGLSPREQEVFDLVVKGYTNQRLAAALFISIKTVETHRTRINKKLGVHSTAELIRFAALSGRLSP